MIRFKIDHLSRRGFLAAAGAGSAAIAITVLPGLAGADLAALNQAIGKVMGDTNANQGRIQLSVPEVAENGRQVAVDITVDSPMTPTDYVKVVHLFVQNNPAPEVASFRFTPDCGRARVSFRCRMGESSPVVALAEMSDGKFFRADRTVKVTIGGCAS